MPQEHLEHIDLVEETPLDNLWAGAGQLATRLVLTGALLAGPGVEHDTTAEQLRTSTPVTSVETAIRTRTTPGEPGEPTIELTTRTEENTLQMEVGADYESDFETDFNSAEAIKDEVESLLQQNPELIDNVDTLGHILIMGSSSAEAGDSPNADIDKLNPENLKLARERAEIVKEALVEQVLDLTGVDISDKISAGSTEHTVDDPHTINDLKALAGQLGFNTINDMIDANTNNPDLLPGAVADFINTAIGADKRGATITATYETVFSEEIITPAETPDPIVQTFEDTTIVVTYEDQYVTVESDVEDVTAPPLNEAVVTKPVVIASPDTTGNRIIRDARERGRISRNNEKGYNSAQQNLTRKQPRAQNFTPKNGLSKGNTRRPMKRTGR